MNKKIKKITKQNKLIRNYITEKTTEMYDFLPFKQHGILSMLLQKPKVTTFCKYEYALQIRSPLQIFKNMII